MTDSIFRKVPWSHRFIYVPEGEPRGAIEAMGLDPEDVSVEQLTLAAFNPEEHQGLSQRLAVRIWYGDLDMVELSYLAFCRSSVLAAQAVDTENAREYFWVFRRELYSTVEYMSSADATAVLAESQARHMRKGTAAGIALDLDTETARDLTEVLVAIGENIAAGAPIPPFESESLNRLGRLLRELNTQLGRQQPYDQ